MLQNCLPVQAQTLTLEPARQAHLRDWPALLSQDGVLGQLTRSLKSKCKLPRILPITFADRGQVNAWYSPSQHSITVDYTLMDMVYNVFYKDPRYRERAQALALSTTRFFLLHEIGHGLIDELGVAYAGKNEDCADELAVILSSYLAGSDGQKDAQAAAQWFLLMGWGKQQDVTKVHFWDEHSFDLQRYFNILVNLEAAKPGSVPELAGKVKADRQARARQRWPGKLAAWGYHLRNSCQNLSPNIQPAPQSGKGTISLSFEETAEPDLQLIRTEMQKLPFAKHLQAFARLFVLPRDLQVVFINTREPVCRYQREQHRVAISYGWILDVGKFLGTQSTDGAQIMQILGSVMTLELSIRLQQMLIEELQIPITGEPEDAAVELLTLAWGDNPGVIPLLMDAANYFRWRAEANPFMLTYDFSSEDDLHHQRFLDLYMALYAFRPKDYEWVKGWVPEARLRRVTLEQPRKLKNWEQLIVPYVRRS